MPYSDNTQRKLRELEQQREVGTLSPVAFEQAKTRLMFDDLQRATTAHASKHLNSEPVGQVTAAPRAHPTSTTPPTPESTPVHATPPPPATAPAAAAPPHTYVSTPRPLTPLLPAPVKKQGAGKIKLIVAVGIALFITFSIMNDDSSDASPHAPIPAAATAPS